MTPAQTFHDQQRARWTGDDGQHWATHQAQLDRMLHPVLKPLVDFAAPVPGSTVIDAGCGCGATILELLRAAGPSGRVVGIDLSEAMLEVAAQRAAAELSDALGNLTLLAGDAAELPLSAIQAELIVSRFGVMFFGDPVAAFANLRTGLAPGGRLRFACWGPPTENPWMQLPLHAVYEHVPRPPQPDPEAGTGPARPPKYPENPAFPQAPGSVVPANPPEEPGPFSFADPARVTRILTAAGFTAPSFTALNIPMELADGGSLDDAVQRSTEFGPLKRALAEQPDTIRAAALESIRSVLRPYASETGVKLPGAAWLVAAGNPAKPKTA